MTPDTVVGLLILVVAVLPGLVYTLAFERQAGDFGATFADRTMRFIAVSVLFHLVVGWPEYWAYRHTLGEPGPISSGDFAILWVAVAVMVIAPAFVGVVLGRAYERRRTLSRGKQKLLQLALGHDVAPRAWDDFFSSSPTAYLRVRTTEGEMLAGLFANRSYAAGFPQEPDLLLEEAYDLDPVSGQLGRGLGYPLYIAAGKIAWIEVVPPESSEGESGD